MLRRPRFSSSPVWFAFFRIGLASGSTLLEALTRFLEVILGCFGAALDGFSYSPGRELFQGFGTLPAVVKPSSGLAAAPISRTVGPFLERLPFDERLVISSISNAGFAGRAALPQRR